MPSPRPESIHVSYFQRAAGVGYSIERLFASVRSGLPPEVAPTVLQAPFASTKPLNLLRNILWARKHRGEINHVTGDAYYLTLGLPPRRTVLTIHDCVALHRLTGWRKWILHRLWYHLPTRRAGVVTVISEEAKRELLSFVPGPAERIRVVPNCIGDEFQPRPKPDLSQPPILLQIGTTPNKNLANVCISLQSMPVRLRVIGNLCMEDRALLDACRIDYTVATGLTDEQVIQEYTACDAVLFVSTYEGFGLPIIEAQAIGRPVVTSNIPPMSDVAGEGACMVDPYDVNSIRRGVSEILSDKTYREHLVSLGYANVHKYRAREIANQYSELYREIAYLNS